jgi:hypothetical protein
MPNSATTLPSQNGPGSPWCFAMLPTKMHILPLPLGWESCVHALVAVLKPNGYRQIHNHKPGLNTVHRTTPSPQPPVDHLRSSNPSSLAQPWQPCYRACFFAHAQVRGLVWIVRSQHQPL